MQVGIMVTNGGPHPPEKWADITATSIMNLIQIEPTAPAIASIEKRELELKIVRLLIALHDGVQKKEQSALGEGGADVLLSDMDPTEDATAATNAIIAETTGGMFEEHFKKQEVRDYIFRVVGQNFCNCIHIERSWHADKNPDDETSKQFREKFVFPAA